MDNENKKLTENIFNKKAETSEEETQTSSINWDIYFWIVGSKAKWKNKGKINV